MMNRDIFAIVMLEYVKRSDSLAPIPFINGHTSIPGAFSTASGFLSRVVPKLKANEPNVATKKCFQLAAHF